MFIILCLVLRLGLNYQIVNAFNCGSQNILLSPHVKYMGVFLSYKKDEMYEGLTSKQLKKQSLPSKYIDPIDMQLLSTERTTQLEAFSYHLRLKGPDYYLLLFKFIQVHLLHIKTVYTKPSERVFSINIGSEEIFQIDLVKEAGVGQVLHKWIQFQLRDQIIYINQTIPVLNGYIYPKQLMKITFSKLVGNPKIEALILVKGSDYQNFLNQYLQYQKQKSKALIQNTSQKYYKPYKFSYKHMTGNETFTFPQQNLMHYIKKIFSVNSLYSLLALFILFFYDRIEARIRDQQVKQQKQKEL